MLRSILVALASAVLVTATFIPDDAYARRGGGGFRGGGGGFHAAGVRGGGMQAGRIARPSHPIAGRPIAGRPVAGYPGRGYYRPGWGYGAAAVGAAAAAGAYGYYNRSSCYYDSYGQYVCPGQYQYQY